jgi:hypothetical protein
MSKITEDADRLINYVNTAKKAGAEAAQGKTNPLPTIGIFIDGFPEWTADDGLEETGHISQYKGMAYQCINAIQRYDNYAPDIATNNYNPYPTPDADGIYPYVYGMGVSIGMKERYNGIVYRAIQAMTKQINPPSDLPAIFVREG